MKPQQGGLLPDKNADQCGVKLFFWFEDGAWCWLRPHQEALCCTKPPFAIGKPFLRQPRGDTRATPEDQRLAIARRSAEIKERRAIFAANANANADTPTNNP